jgi:hypothetical protein
MRSSSDRFTVFAILLALASAAPAVADSAAMGEPWILDSNNWQQAENLLPEVVLERIKKGDYWYKVQPVDPEKFKANYSPQFWAATESNAGKYDVKDDICGLQEKATGKLPDYWFGLPFPQIDPKDPKAGCKMAWNFEAANSHGRWRRRHLHAERHRQQRRVQAHQALAAFKAFLGRHGGPIEQPEEPALRRHDQRPGADDVDGVGGLTKRENDWVTQDKAGSTFPRPAACAASTLGDALRSGRRPRHLLRRPQLLRRQDRVLQVEAARRGRDPGAGAQPRPAGHEEGQRDPLEHPDSVLQGPPTRPRAARACRG